MAVDQEMIQITMQTSEYQNGLAILGDPDDYATRTMIEFIGFFYVLTIREQGSAEQMENYIRQMGIVLGKNEQGVALSFEDEEALVTAFTYIVGRNTKEFFEQFLKHRAEFVSGEN
ncbi:MAG: hypothetical protein IJ906_12760 [Oscillospiraceae bacterium]|nr:hypothetical protein [Oscillospiraceae bacterium]